MGLRGRVILCNPTSEVSELSFSKVSKGHRIGSHMASYTRSVVSHSPRLLLDALWFLAGKGCGLGLDRVVPVCTTLRALTGVTSALKLLTM